MNYKANYWVVDSGPHQGFDTNGNTNFPNPHPLSLVDLENHYLFSGCEPSSSANPLLSSYEMKLADPIGRLSLSPLQQSASERRNSERLLVQSCDSISSFENLTSLVHLPSSPNQDVSTDNSERGGSSKPASKGVGRFCGIPNQTTEIEREYEAEDREIHEDGEECEARRKKHPRKRSVGRNLKERDRRQRINQKIHALHDLVPNKNQNKDDKVSMLNDVVEYMKALQNQDLASSVDGSLQPCTTRYFLPAVGLSPSHDSTLQNAYRMQRMSFSTPLTQSFSPTVLLFPCTHGVSPFPAAVFRTPVLPQSLPMNLSISEPGSSSQSARND